MFSFINFIQAMIKSLKKRKGLWFTLLTIVSTLGIVVSMTLINSMTHNVAHKIYMKVSKVNSTLLENILDQRYDTLLSISNVISIHPDIITSLKTKSDTLINEQLVSVQKRINDSVNIDPITIHYYSKDFKASKSENFKYADVVLSSDISLTGIVVNSVGVRIIVISPVKDNNTTIGAIEVSQDISTLKNSFQKYGKDFVFLLDEPQLAFIDLEHKQGMLEDINERYKIFYHDYDPAFYTYLTHIDFDELAKTKYHIDKAYYIDINEALDVDRKPIGVFIIGERAENGNSFVRITQNLIESVTITALGLVISLILFMF